MTDSAKIHARHRDRRAVVYLRQSSPKQVLHHKESALNQRALVGRLREFGWPDQRIEVIDDDQGRSGRTAAGRDGFQRLVADVSLGKVGIVIGSEVSRLSRNCADWHKLLELCALFDTLIADADGVYNPRDFNDRILLGLKGTLSEAELHSIRQRLDAGRLSKARRGELVQHLPTGFVRDAAGAVILDPDESIRDRIRLVFERFLATGSVQKVLRSMVADGLQLPRRQTSGLHAGEVLWKRPNTHTLYSMLKNPAYAGAFVYGRRIADPTRQTPGRPATGRIRQGKENWIALVRDVYPEYISWDQHQQIQDTMTKHHQAMQERVAARQAVRRGRALLAGLLKCGFCGRGMYVQYKGDSHQYTCHVASKCHGLPTCQYLSGRAIDDAVVGEFFEVLQPASIDALECVNSEREAHHAEVIRHLEQDVQRLEYAANRAQRQYDQVEPENRLIASTLERKWEAALSELEQARTRLEEECSRMPQPEAIPRELREAFADAGRRMPQVWPRLSAEARKEMLRTLVTRVNLKRGEGGIVQMRIAWAGGLVTERSVRVPVSSLRKTGREREVVDRIRELISEGEKDEAIAGKLNEQGLKPCRGESFTAGVVRNLRGQYGLRIGLGRRRSGERLSGYTVAEIAKAIGVDASWISRAISRGRLVVAKNKLFGCYLFPREPDTIRKFKELKAGKLRQVSFPEVHNNG
jgi:DNA invertase Pin-like site-specific DNA recombinase